MNTFVYCVHSFAKVYCVCAFICEGVLCVCIHLRRCTVCVHSFAKVYCVCAFFCKGVLCVCIHLRRCTVCVHSFAKVYCVCAFICEGVLCVCIHLQRCTVCVHSFAKVYCVCAFICEGVLCVCIHLQRCTVCVHSFAKVYCVCAFMCMWTWPQHSPRPVWSWTGGKCDCLGTYSGPLYSRPLNSNCPSIVDTCHWEQMICYTLIQNSFNPWNEDISAVISSQESPFWFQGVRNTGIHYTPSTTVPDSAQSLFAISCRIEAVSGEVARRAYNI